MDNEFSQALPLLDFDRELDLADLLDGINKERLSKVLAELLGSPFSVYSKNGDQLLGESVDGMPCRVAIRAEMEAVGYLESQENVSAKLQSAATLVELLLQSEARYLMASSLHLHAVKDDYEKLQAKHSELIASEARYKELAENLEQRVKEQVKTIECAQSQLYQAEKMASVGQLAAGVAHEINNPIGFIKSNLMTAKSYVGEMAELARQVNENKSLDVIKSFLKSMDIDYMLDDFEILLNESIDGVERVSSIVKDLKGLSDVEEGEEEIADVNDIIRKVCNVSLKEITRHAELKLNLADELPHIKSRPSHLGQVFLNILMNAGKAIKEEGEISIETSLGNNNIHVHISDTGSGISESDLKRIFDPFFTTADVGEGAGLGLTVSRDIVKSYGGEIDVKSKLGYGSTFIITFPVYLQPPSDLSSV